MCLKSHAAEDTQLLSVFILPLGKELNAKDHLSLGELFHKPCSNQYGNIIRFPLAAGKSLYLSAFFLLIGIIDSYCLTAIGSLNDVGVPSVR